MRCYEIAYHIMNQYDHHYWCYAKDFACIIVARAGHNDRDRPFLNTNKLVGEKLRQGVIKYQNGINDHRLPCTRIAEKN